MQAKLDMVVTFTSISEEGAVPPDVNVPQPETKARKINHRKTFGIGFGKIWLFLAANSYPN